MLFFVLGIHCRKRKEKNNNHCEMYFVHFYFVIEKKNRISLFWISCLKLSWDNPISAIRIVNFVYFCNHTSVSIIKKTTHLFEFHFFFSFVQTNLLSGFQMIVCYSALWRDWHQNIELNTLSEQRVLLWTEWNTHKKLSLSVCPKRFSFPFHMRNIHFVIQWCKV